MNDFKLSKPQKIPAYKLALPCDKCGVEKTTVRMYLQNASDRKIPKGFYSDLAIRLCKGCLEKALSLFEK